MSIHTALLAEQSLELRTLVGRPMKEARSGEAEWPEVDPATFARFAQFVYTGDYCTTMKDSPGGATDNGAIEEPIDPEQETGLGSRVGSSSGTNKKDKKKRRKTADDAGFHDLIYRPPPSFAFHDECQIHPIQDSAKDYRPVFLGHARLYVFAEEKNLRPLKALVLHKLHALLCEYSPHETRYGDFVELIRYVYEHTPSREHMEQLRELVTLYVVRKQVQIAVSDPCLALFEEGGPFSRDLLCMMVRRIQGSIPKGFQDL